MPGSNLPALREMSPLAEGGTVNIRKAGELWQLRIWIQGAAVEDSYHASPTHALVTVARILADRLGGEQAILAALLQGMAQRE